MRTLIVGCGFLGLRVARLWREAGHRVAAVTRSAERAAALRDSGIDPIVADVMQPHSLAGLPQADVLLYAVGYDPRSSHSKRDVYVGGLDNVLRAGAARVERLVYVSSTSVYGQTDGERVNEESPCEPASENGRTCLEAEAVVRRHFRAEMINCRSAHVLRMSGLYGPGRLIARVEALRAGAPVTGNPDAWLNLIHVEDAARVVVACVERDVPGDTYLVSDDRPVTRREYYGRLAALIGAPAPSFCETASASTRTTGLNKRCDNSRMRRELLPELIHPTIEQGLVDAISGAR